VRSIIAVAREQTTSFVQQYSCYQTELLANWPSRLQLMAVNPFSASYSKLLLFEVFSAILV